MSTDKMFYNFPSYSFYCKNKSCVICTYIYIYAMTCSKAFSFEHPTLSGSTHPDFGLTVEMWQDTLEQITHQCWLVVSGRVECHQSHSPHVQVLIMQSFQEVTHCTSQERINGLGLKQNQ